MIPSREERGFRSPFRRLLLTDWYDGPKAGLAIDLSGGVYAFSLLDWDDVQGVRVFRLSIVPELSGRDVEAAFGTQEFAGERTGWVLPPSLPPRAEEVLQRAETTGRVIAVLATSDLLGLIDVWRPTSETPATSTVPEWLERLGLPRAGRGSES
jgi:hypothetical protein